MTFTIDPNLIENNEVRLTEDGNGELAIEHISTGNTVTVDQDVAVSDIATDKLPSNLDAQGNDINNVGSLKTANGNIASLSDSRHYAGAFDGGDHESRLDNAIEEASNYDVIYLEAAEYAERTISKPLLMIGHLTSADDIGGTTIDGSGGWTFTSEAHLHNVNVRNGPVRMEAPESTVSNGRYGGAEKVEAAADELLVTGVRRADIIFESGTSNGLADSCISSTVNDNGSNTVGDIS